MSRYIVTIEEICADSFCVEADSLQNAIKIARNKYSSGIFVLEPGYLFAKQLQCQCPDTNESTDWIKF